MLTAHISPADLPALAASAEALGLEPSAEEPAAEPFLRLEKDGLSLCAGALALRGDFARLKPRLRKTNLGGELLVRAAKLKGEADGLTVADATAGLGEDALLLAAAGFSVRLFERDPVIAALLRDALRRAAEDTALAEIVARMTFCGGDSIDALPQLVPAPDVVYLDPMFPARQKSGLVKKKFQLLHLLEQPCSDEEALYRAAVSADPRRIVIKRPAGAPSLAGVKPSFCLEKGGIRYDCVVLRA